MLYPMYTSPMEEVLKMTKIEPHEVLKEKGIVAEFDPRQGKGFFVSHQWVGGNHPDPHFQQFQARVWKKTNKLKNNKAVSRSL